jgi:hypothetical protein
LNRLFGNACLPLAVDRKNNTPGYNIWDFWMSSNQLIVCVGLKQGWIVIGLLQGRNISRRDAIRNMIT